MTSVNSTSCSRSASRPRSPSGSTRARSRSWRSSPDSSASAHSGSPSSRAGRSPVRRWPTASPAAARDCGVGAGPGPVGGDEAAGHAPDQVWSWDQSGCFDRCVVSRVACPSARSTKGRIGSGSLAVARARKSSGKSSSALPITACTCDASAQRALSATVSRRRSKVSLVLVDDGMETNVSSSSATASPSRLQGSHWPQDSTARNRATPAATAAMSVRSSMT